jgi:cytosine/creatinine deaminase
MALHRVHEILTGLDRYWLTDARVHTSLLAGPAPASADKDGLVRVDIRVEDGRIGAVAPLATAPTDEPRLSLDGGQVWPGLVDLHTHLDKGHIWPRAENLDGTFQGAITANIADRTAHWTAADIEARFEFGLRCSWVHGTTAIRTHLDGGGPLTAVTWDVFAALRDRWAGRIALQASAMSQPMHFLPGGDGPALAATVARHGGVLGCVTYMHPELDTALDTMFALAEAHGLALDLHVDETADPAADSLRRIAEIKIRRGFAGSVNVGHCCSLARQDDDTILRTLDRVATAGLSVVSLPMCNMYLQDRTAGRTPRWRGVTLLHEMKARGTRVSVSSDNCRDPFYGYGDHDLIEVYREATRILHLDRPFADWPMAVAGTPADVMGIGDRHGRIGAGRMADLILFRARHFSELLSRPQSDRVVLRAGRPVSDPLPDHRELDRLFPDAGADAAGASRHGGTP